LTSVLYSVELTRNEPLIEMTRSAVERIDWTLREVLPGDQPARLQRNAVATEQRKVS
jgi:hypothetical protein